MIYLIAIAIVLIFIVLCLISILGFLNRLDGQINSLIHQSNLHFEYTLKIITTFVNGHKKDKSLKMKDDKIITFVDGPNIEQ